MDRATHTRAGWRGVEERAGDALQGVVDQAPPAARYFSDGLSVSPTLMGAPGQQRVAPGKNKRQLWQRAHPSYRGDIIDFLPLLT